MSREIIYRGKKIDLAVDSETLPDGTIHQREIILHRGAVVILPLLAGDRICLLRNFRPAVGETLIEVPAGTLEPGEAPAVAAPRELAEETGYQARSWRLLAEFFPSPGVMSERMFLYLAEDLTPGPPRPEKDERLEPFIATWEEALAWTQDGTIRDGKTLVALLLWDRLRQKSANPATT